MHEDEKYPSQTAERFQVRLPDGMRDRIAYEAKAAGRSMNAEIVHRLNWTLDPELTTAVFAEKALEDVMSRLGKIVPRLEQIASGALGLQPPDLTELDAWISDLPDPKPSRPEAIRQMVRFALNVRRKDREMSGGAN